MAGFLKASTGLTGLAVAKHPHNSLKVLYEKILKTLSKMPDKAGYRIHTQKAIQERLNVVQSEPMVDKLEAKINSGQIEELILQAERELLLSRKMLQWQPWEQLETHPPPNQWKWPM